MLNKQPYGVGFWTNEISPWAGLPSLMPHVVASTTKVKNFDHV